MNSMSGYRGPGGGNISNRQSGNFRGDVIPSGYKSGQLQQFTPEMMDLFQQLFSHVSPDSDLSRLASGDESYFGETEAPSWRKFQEAQGQLGSRFSQLAPGSMSAQRGSGFQNTAGQLGSDFAMNLASRRKELQRQAIMDLMGISNSLLDKRPYERTLTEKPREWWETPLSGFAGGFGQKAGESFGNIFSGFNLFGG